jgi:hypothetical protein
VPDHTEADTRRALDQVRASALQLPETSERLSHGGPAFFVRDKTCFAMFLDDHHGDGRLALWCAAPEGVQAELIELEPERFFRPPYVGHRGWLGVHLLTVDQSELDAVVLDAFRTVAPPTVLRRLDAR